MYKLLLIDDEPELLDVTVSYLAQAGFESRGLSDSKKAIDTIREFNPDVLLVDRMMPDVTGNDIVREIRRHADLAKIRVIMVTALGSEPEVIEGFQMGIDDYVTKPYSMVQLTERVRALCRRIGTPRQSEGLHIDRTLNRVTIDRQNIPMTQTEFNLLTELFFNQGQVQSRDLLRAKALLSENVSDRTIDVHLASIRRKLGLHGERIKTVRGIGYKMVPSEAEVAAQEQTS